MDAIVAHTILTQPYKQMSTVASVILTYTQKVQQATHIPHQVALPPPVGIVPMSPPAAIPASNNISMISQTSNMKDYLMGRILITRI